VGAAALVEALAPGSAVCRRQSPNCREDLRCSSGSKHRNCGPTDVGLAKATTKFGIFRVTQTCVLYRR